MFTKLNNAERKNLEDSIAFKSTGSGAKQPGFMFQLLQLLTM